MDKFDVIKTLGRGAFAEVKLIKKKTTGEMFVAKVFHTAMSDLSERERLEIAQEIKLLAHLSHPNIVRFVDNFVEDDRMRIIMEYASGGSLDRKVMLQEGNLFEEERIWEYFVYIVAALKYVHSVHVLHRDLKPYNILLTGPQHRIVKLADFGIAKVLSSKTEQAQTLIGTPYFLSPELCAGSKYDSKSDVWALGCILYELAQLRKPFDGSNMPAIFLSIMRSKPRALPSKYSKELRGLAALLLRPRPEDRPSLADLERMPAVEARWKKWRATRRRLMAPLPTPKGMGGSGGGAGGRPPSSGGGDSPMPTGGDEDDDLSAARGREGVLLQVVPQTPSSVRYKLRKEAAELEAKLTDEVSLLARQSQAASRVEDADRLQVRLREIVSELMEKGQGFGAAIWEQLGRACADSGAFDEAIQSYRQALSRSSSSNQSSMNTMEQLGNLLVRRAQQVWAMARLGREQEALEAGRKALVGRNQLMGKHGRRAGARRRSRGIGRGSRLGRGARGGGDTPGAGRGQAGGGSELETGDPEWKKLAAELMVEGVMHIERLRSLLPTPERCSLLGSAFKRRAWTGLGDSRKKDLQYAAEAYREAWNMELGRAEDEVERLDAETGLQGTQEQEEAKKDEKMLIRSADDQEDLHVSDSSDSAALEDEEDYAYALSMGGGDGSGTGTGRSSMGGEDDADTEDDEHSKDPVAKQRRRLGRRRERLMLRPNPYARLNQLTLELLAGSGSKRRVARLARRVREAEFFASKKKEREASDVWLWVQVVDARCLRYLIDDGRFDSEYALKDEAGIESADPSGGASDAAAAGDAKGGSDGPADPRKRPNPLMEAPTLQTVSAGYKEQFVFGATQRVRSSVMDQLGFLEEVLQGRVKEEEDKQPTPRVPPAGSAAAAAAAATGKPSGRGGVEDSMSSMGESGSIAGMTPKPGGDGQLGASVQPALPGQVESPRAVAVPKPSGASSGAGAGSRMADWPADPNSVGVGEGESKQDSGGVPLPLPLAGLKGPHGVEGTQGALSARSRRRESTLSWLRSLLKRTQALSLLLRQHANQARISLDPTSTPRATKIAAKSGGPVQTFASSDVIDAIPEDKEGEEASSSAGARSPKGMAPMTSASIDLSAARMSATGRSLSPTDGGTGGSRKGPPLRLDVGGGNAQPGGSPPSRHQHHTSDGNDLGGLGSGGPKLGMLTPHAANHQTAKASALQRGLDAVAKLDFDDASRKAKGAGAGDSGKSSGKKSTGRGVGGLAGYSGNPFAKSAKKHFVAGESGASVSSGGARTRTQDSVNLTQGFAGEGSTQTQTTFDHSVAGPGNNAEPPKARAPRNGIGGVAGFKGNPFGRKAKVAFKAGAAAPAPAPVAAAATAKPGELQGANAAASAATGENEVTVSRPVPGRSMPDRLSPRAEPATASKGSQPEGILGAAHGGSVASVSDINPRARNASSRSIHDPSGVGVGQDGGTAPVPSAAHGTDPMREGSGEGETGDVVEGSVGAARQATPSAVSLRAGSQEAGGRAAVGGLELPNGGNGAVGDDGAPVDSARTGSAGESTSAGSQRNTVFSTDGKEGHKQGNGAEGPSAGPSESKESTGGGSGADYHNGAAGSKQQGGEAKAASGGCGCVVS